jgi:N-acetylneuraminate synthase/N,N'-diacetyllegionaminate synthase
LSGDGLKHQAAKLKNIVIVKIIHLKSLSKGHVVTEEDIVSLRPGDGISQWNGKILLEKILNKDKRRI